jgi:hypothetical protein
MQWQHLTNGVVTPVAQRTSTFDAASFEASVTTTAPKSNTASGFQHMLLLPPFFPRLGPTTIIGARRVSNVLALDFVTDTTLGDGLGIPAENRLTVLAVPSADQSIALLQYTVSLDGSAGDHVIGGVFVPFNTGHAFTLALDQISVAGTTSDFPVTVTHLPTTHTVIPSPTVATLLAISALRAARRRR